MSKDKYDARLLILGVTSKEIPDQTIIDPIDSNVISATVSLSEAGISGRATDWSWIMYNTEIDTGTVTEENMGVWANIINSVLFKAKAEGYHYVMFDIDGPDISEWLSGQ